MFGIENWQQILTILFIGFIFNTCVSILELGNFFASDELEGCKIRPDIFWRSLLLFQMLTATGLMVFTVEPEFINRLLPGAEFNRRTKDLMARSFFALEISGFLSFFILVILAYSICSVRGVWIGLYYWIMAVLGFLLAASLTFLWVAAGNLVFLNHNNGVAISVIILPFLEKIRNAETEDDQRLHYKNYRAVMDGHEGFTEIDFRFIEKYSTYKIENPSLELDSQKYNHICIQCDAEFKIGDRMLIFRDCLHACHLTCLIHSLRASDLCFCGSGLRQILTEPSFPGGKKEDLRDLIGLHPAIPIIEAIILSRHEPQAGELADPDVIDYVNFWDIMEDGVVVGPNDPNLN
jgi:hypothetical protein